MPDPSSGTGWGGDTDDAYVSYATELPCRYEVMRSRQGDTDDVTRYLVFLFTETDPVPDDDHRCLVDGLTLRVDTVMPYTQFDGTFHHYELECLDDLDPEDG